MADFKKEIYPDEIAQTLCNLASENPDEQTVNDCEEAIQCNTDGRFVPGFKESYYQKKPWRSRNAGMG